MHVEFFTPLFNLPISTVALLNAVDKEEDENDNQFQLSACEKRERGFGEVCVCV